jgi:hypothetical protein
MILGFLLLILFICCYNNWSIYVETFLHHCNETNLIMVYDLKVFDPIFRRPCSFMLFFMWWSSSWTQGLSLARQALYHLNLSTSPFCFAYFWDRVLNYSLGWLRPWPNYMWQLFTTAPSLWLILGFRNFCLGCSPTTILLISTSKTSRITGLSHCDHPGIPAELIIFTLVIEKHRGRGIVTFGPGDRST